MSGNSKLVNNASRVATFSREIVFTETKIPEASDDFVTRFKENTSARKDVSNEFTIDVLPNMVPILSYILYHVNKYSMLMEQSLHAKISPGTFTAYCLAIVYGYILAADSYVRHAPSQHASEWMNSEIKNRFLHYLLSLPVPDFLQPVLLKMMPTTTERRGNITFCPSAAGFSYHHYFGKFFPLIMFTNLHDVAAENPSNQPPYAILSDYMLRPLYTITKLRTGAAPWMASPAHFLGTWFLVNGSTSTDQCSMNSRLEQHFQSVFNPVLFRDYQRRKTLASVSLASPTFPDANMNFYDIVFACAKNTATMNLSELRTVFDSVNASLRGNVKCTGDLASMFKSVSGQSILDHGYSTIRLPTYHHSTTFPQKMDSRPKNVSPSDFASAIRFLQPENEHTIPQRHTQNQPTAVCKTDKSHPTAVSFTSALNLLLSSEPENQYPDLSSDFTYFTEELHVYPKVYVLTQEGSSVDAWRTLAFGFVIESTDLDGTVVPVPNTQLNLGIENSWFADSAIPIRYCRPQTSHNVQATESRTIARNRKIAPRQTRFPAASLLVDRTTVRIPQASPTTINATTSQTFAGLTPITGVYWFQTLQSFLGFRTRDRRDRDPSCDEIPGMTEGTINLWSPYTYTAFEGENGYEPNYSKSAIYFISNLRTIFGTDYPLFECNDALESMPIV